MKKTRLLSLIEKSSFSKNLDLFILGGKELEDFPLNQESGYVKLLFPETNDSLIEPQRLNDKAYFSSLRKRTFTIYKFDNDKKQLHLLGVKHSAGCDDQGPANQWIESVNPGDSVAISGPGDKKLINPDAEWIFLAGDMTALPAIIINLQQLEENAKGYCVIEVIHKDDIVTLQKPNSVEIIWVINDSPKKPNTVLADKVKSLPWLNGSVSVWLAGEFAMMRSLRRYFKKEQQVERGKIYASSYWKINESDEGNKKAKKIDANENPEEQV